MPTNLADGDLNRGDYNNLLFATQTCRPFYAFHLETYWQTHQTSNNLHVACLAVQEVIAQRPDTLSLLNRYGSHSPTYEAQELCPF